MEYNIICLIMFTLTSSAHNSAILTENIYNRNIFNKHDDTHIQSTQMLNSENLAQILEFSTSDDRFQYDATPNKFHTKRLQPVVAVSDATAKLDASTNQPLQWTMPDSRRWFATLLSSRITKVDSAQPISEATTAQSISRDITLKSTLGSDRLVAISVQPLSKVAAVVVDAPEKLPLISQRENNIPNRIFKAHAKSAMQPHNENDYVAISIFDDHGHIVRRMIPKVLIEANTVTTHA